MRSHDVTVSVSVYDTFADAMPHAKTKDRVPNKIFFICFSFVVFLFSVPVEQNVPVPCRLYWLV